MKERIALGFHTCVDYELAWSTQVVEAQIRGTPTRAAIVLERLGYPTILQTSCYNEHVKRLMPAGVRVLPGRSSDYSGIFPHVLLQCSSGVRIQANDIDFVTPIENRILISRSLW